MARWTVKLVALTELSNQFSTTPACVRLGETSAVGISGVAVNTTERIMSFSSWLRMWQCHTYSQPKLWFSLVMPASSRCRAGR